MPLSGSAAELTTRFRVTFPVCLLGVTMGSFCFWGHLLTLPVQASSTKGTPQTALRFFFAGNGRLEMEHAHFKERLEVCYRNSDGSYDAAAREQIDRFFRSRSDDQTQPIPLRLVELLAYLQNRYRARPMVLLSGYRSPEFNNLLGAQGQAVALASLHTQGLAADIALPHMDLRKLWLRLRLEEVGGVGFYQRQRFLHIDVGPPRFWEETTSRVTENLSAGNARIFARTDFDRYHSLNGTRLRLHSVTALPLRIARTVHADTPDGIFRGELIGLNPGIELHEGCWVIRQPAARYEFEVRTTEPAVELPKGQRFVLKLQTCEPRVERTPPEFVTNPVELF